MKIRSCTRFMGVQDVRIFCKLPGKETRVEQSSHWLQWPLLLSCAPSCRCDHPWTLGRVLHTLNCEAPQQAGLWPPGQHHLLLLPPSCRCDHHWTLGRALHTLNCEAPQKGGLWPPGHHHLLLLPELATFSPSAIISSSFVGLPVPCEMCGAKEDTPLHFGTLLATWWHVILPWS